MRIRKFGLGAVVAAVTLSVAAIGYAAANSDHGPSDADYLFSHLHARSHSVDAVWLESSLAETLPSRQFSVNGAPAAARGSGVVIGRVTDVRKGRGFSHKDDAPVSTEVAFDSPDALWRTVEVTVAVEEAWGKVASQTTVTFAVVIDGGASGPKAIRGLQSLDRVFVGLNRQGRYAYSPQLYSISRNGDLFGTVDAAGAIVLPVMDHDDDFMKGVDTVDELRAEAAKAPQLIRVDFTEGTPSRR